LIKNTTDYTPADAGTYYAQTRNKTTDCISDSRTAVILTIKPTPQATAKSNSPLCEGETLELYSSSSLADVVYSWFKVGGSTPIIAQYIKITNATSLNSGTYILKIDLNGCTATDTIKVIVKPKPQPKATIQNAAVCEGFGTKLSVNDLPMATYNWTGPANFVSAQRGPLSSNLKPNQSGFYVVEVTVNDCVASDSVRLTVNPRPSIKSNPPVCAAGLATYSVKATATGGVVSASVGTVTDDGSGNYTISNVPASPTAQNVTLYATSPQGCRDSILVKAPDCQCPAVNSAKSLGDAEICFKTPNPTLKVTVGTNETADWYDELGVKVATANTQFTPTVSAVGSYVYYVETRRTDISVRACVSSTRTAVKLTIKPLPVAVASSNGILCEGEDLELAAKTVSGAIFNWTATNYNATEQNPTRVKATPAMSGDYILTVTLNGCITKDTVLVKIKPKPVANASAGNTASLCDGGTITLNTDLVTNATYNWIGPNNFTSDQRSPQIANAVSDNAGRYIVLVSLNGCTNTDTVNVIVRESPVARANNSSPSCEGDSVVLSAANDPSAAFVWKNATGETIGTTSQVIIKNTIPSQSGIYTLTTTKNNCSHTDTTKVLVKPRPVAVATGGVICAGNTIELKANAVANATYQWQGPNAFSSSLQNPTVSNADTLKSGVYSLTVTLNGCSRTDTALVKVKKQPTAQALNNGPLCVGDTLRLSAATAGAGVSYVWKTPSGTTLSGQTVIFPKAQLAQTGKYILTVSLNGCSDTDTSVVVVKTLPDFIVSSNSPVCLDGAIELFTKNPPAGAIFSWSGANQFTSMVQNPVIQNASLAMNGLYSITVKLNNCVKTDTLSVRVKKRPVIKAIADSPVCEGDNSNLSVDLLTNTTYRWKGPLNYASVLRNPTIVNLKPNQSGFYVVEATIEGCAAVDSIKITVNPKPKITVQAPVCATDLTTYFVKATATGGVVSASVGTVTNNGAGSYTVANIPSIKNVTLSITSPQGCRDSILVKAPNCLCPVVNAPVNMGDTSVLGQLFQP
jgi:hypothetical protein